MNIFFIQIMAKNKDKEILLIQKSVLILVSLFC